ncbi:hypothetical protein NUU61_006538 [Penicillium alfredii]|uniref:Penicillopepsin n=1 Tax=Penicillium alfredii TaxID=1506179 RepID=A0A9W9F132_9EURO|nr:uncharacterized protein NUU61_006538 [Penicillium alfredii]KAJ5091668.1 hypothetical protein NUU61_006538 [Penicillium alfredii]
MSPNTSVILLLASLASLSGAYIYVSDADSYTPSAALASGPMETSLVWRASLAAIDPAMYEVSWGPYVSQRDKQGKLKYYPQTAGLSINNHTSFPPVEESGSNEIVRANISLSHAPYRLKANQYNEVTLGPNSVLNYSQSLNSASYNQTATVPFGLNLGRAGWNDGSLIFGGGVPSYDANRVQSKPWYILPGSENGVFLQNGVVNLTHKVTIQEYERQEYRDSANLEKLKGKPQSYRASINFNSDWTLLPPSASFCGSNFSVTLKLKTSSAELEDVSFKFLFASGDRPGNTPHNGYDGDGGFHRCKAPLTKNDSTIEFGASFFSYTYIMVPSVTSPLYLTLPNTYDLPPKPAVFHPDETLKAPPSPTTSVPWATTSSSASGVTGFSGLLCMMGTVLSLVWL